MASPPPYTPAPAFCRGSPLTTQQLIADFQDFYANLEHISCAPVFVFERLVSNLNQVFTTALERERLRHAVVLERERLQHITAVEKNEALQLENDELKKELAELKKARSTGNTDPVTEPEISNNPVIGTFDTLEVRPDQSPYPDRTSKKVSFTNPYSTPPGIVVGFNVLNIAKDANIRVNSYASNIQNDSFSINIDSWGDTKLCYSSCSWLEVAPNDPDFQFGIFDTREDHSVDERQVLTTRLITFPRAYCKPPQVVVWLSSLDLCQDMNGRVNTYADNITATGFTLHIDSRWDSVIHSASASWVAYTGDKPNVHSGRFSTLDVRPLTPHQLYNGGYQRFGSNVFTAPPRVFLAINSFDIGCKEGVRLKVKASVSTFGMAWHIDGWDTHLYSAGASYIALG